MGIFKLNPRSYVKIEEKGEEVILIKNEIWSKFNSSVLGVGEINSKSEAKDVICAFFDLEGFTKFCNQIDFHLVIPVYLKNFLDWFLEEIKKETLQIKYNEGIYPWHDLPFMIKFMGDGLLILWDISTLLPIVQGNIVISCLSISQKYNTEFLPLIRRNIVDPPNKLRCGITKGRVYSIGKGQDFVGQCINFASRLQKLPGISFVFSNRGMIIEEFFSEKRQNEFLTKIIEVRGIGDNELIFILRDEYDKMNEKDKIIYRDL